jgi:hypothetical protein
MRAGSAACSRSAAAARGGEPHPDATKVYAEFADELVRIVDPATARELDSSGGHPLRDRRWTHRIQNLERIVLVGTIAVENLLVFTTPLNVLILKIRMRSFFKADKDKTRIPSAITEKLVQVSPGLDVLHYSEVTPCPKGTVLELARSFCNESAVRLISDPHRATLRPDASLLPCGP